MANIYLFKYNNYYNRILKVESTLTAYGDPMSITQTSNFNPNDGIMTTHIINADFEYAVPDYCVVCNDYNQIESRWFVMESKRTRKGQYRISLLRDTLAEYKTEILDSICFIEKGYVPPQNPLIFNPEALTFNQIKKSEMLLKDQSKCPWICIYAARKTGTDVTTFNVEILGDSDIIPVKTFENTTDLTAWLTEDIKGNGYTEKMELMGLYRGQGTSILRSSATYYWEEQTVYITNIPIQSVGRILKNGKNFNSLDVYSAIYPIRNSVKDELPNYIPGYDQIEYNLRMSYQGQYVRAGTRYYKLKVASKEVKGTLEFGNNRLFNNIIWPSVKNLYEDETTPSSGQKNIGNLGYGAQQLVISAEEVSISSLTANIGVSRTHLKDAPYDMFVMPYSDTLNLKCDNNTAIPASKSIAYRLAQEIALKYGYGDGYSIYDIQILPYCPLINSTIDENTETITINGTDNYTPIFNDTAIVGYIFHADYSSFSRQLFLENPIIISNAKIQNETDLYRLCSPNYNGVFEFSAAKNGGLSVINIQCTYKPYTPYIKLFPQWGLLYGSDFAEGDYDARGLICGGDFSIPIVTSSWINYQLQNKNYQNIFDRQIENLEVQNKYARISDIANIVTGTSEAAITGAMVGSAFMPGVGTAIGAAAGAAGSFGAGIADAVINEKLRREQMNYAKDQYAYQLGNIKALPQSISRTTAFNVDNKYFPFIEYYSCSDEEKEALTNKIKYNGMSVGVIGKIKDYLNGLEEYTFIQAELIEIDIEAEYNTVVEIGRRLQGGIRIG